MSDKLTNEYIIVENEIKTQIVKQLATLTKQLTSEYPSVHISPTGVNNIDVDKRKIKQDIENIFAEVIKQISEDVPPVLYLRNRTSWQNCSYGDRLYLKKDACTRTEVNFSNKKSMPKFSLIMFLLSKIYKLIAIGETCTKRELYYQNIEFISDQSLVDAALNDITCLLNQPLYNLNVYATSKGLVSGPLTLVTPKTEINCGFDSKGDINYRGILIPYNVNEIINLKSDAKFVLLVEKDTVFQKLGDFKALDQFPPCIFVTGKGMPDINTRILLKKIWEILQIPILALVDSDPWGLEILFVYRFGSRSMSHQADNLAVPSIRWLGPYPSEVSKLVDRCAQLSALDRNKLADLISRLYVKDNDKLREELEFMLTSGVKAEIEDLNASNPGYLINMYLPHKLCNGNFI